jgi:hypothetical protein
MPPPVTYPPIQNPDGTWSLDPREVNTGYDPAFREHRDTQNLHTLTNENLEIRAPMDVREIMDLMDRFVSPMTPYRQQRKPWTVREMRTNIAEFYRLMRILYDHSPSLQENPVFGEAYAEIQRTGVGKISGMHIAYLHQQIGAFITTNKKALTDAIFTMLGQNRIRGGGRMTQKNRRSCRRSRQNRKRRTHRRR